MKILGCKFFTHDSALCLLDVTKKTVFAISTERLTRIKHDWRDISVLLEYFNINETDYFVHGYADFSCPNGDRAVSILAILANEIELVRREIIEPQYIKDLFVLSRAAFLWRLIKKPRLLGLYFCLSLAKIIVPKSWRLLNEAAMNWYIKSQVEDSGCVITSGKIDYVDHHYAHALSAYWLSESGGTQSACISLTIDGFGDGFFSKVYLMQGKKVKEIAQSRTYALADGRVCSLGELYGDFTSALGFTKYADEGKVEALAAFGKTDKHLYEALNRAIYVEDVEIKIDPALYANYTQAYIRTQVEAIGKENVSATIQTLLEDLMVVYTTHIHQRFPHCQLVLSGGVAANIIMTLNIYEKSGFNEIFVVPPMGDDGIALGAAIAKALELDQDVSWLSKLQMPYFGPEVDAQSVAPALKKFSDVATVAALEGDWRIDAAKEVANGKIIAVVDGRMEFGPRALGNRSVLANPLLSDTRDRINSTVKKRPMFQPFCPSILEDERERLFEKSFRHRHMATAFRLKKEFLECLPCAVHVDGTARPQFVTAADNANFYHLLTHFKELTGFGVMINTSFNLHGRTIVLTAEDAITDFIDCNLDYLYLNGVKIKRV